MALEDNTGQDQSSVAPGSDRLNQQQPQQRSQPRQTGGGFRTFLGNQGRPFNTNSSGELVQKLMTAFNGYLENEVSKKDTSFKLLEVNGDAVGLAKSAIVLCRVMGNDGRALVAYHVMVIEGTNALPRKHINLGNTQIETRPTAGDVCDKVFQNAIDNLVRSTYGGLGRGIDILEAGPNVIYSEADLTDQNQLRAIFMTAINAIHHAYQVNRQKSDEEQFNADKLGSNDKLYVEVNMNPGPARNTSGLPIRSDVNIQLQVVSQQSSQSQIDQQTGVVEVDGYVDLVYTPPAGQANPYNQFAMQQQGVMMDTRRFTPRFVATRIHSLLQASDIGFQMLGLMASTVLSEDFGGGMLWTEAFANRHSSAKDKDVDIRDIGAIGYMVNLMGDQGKPGMINTKTNFSDRDRNQFLAATMFPNLIYSIDVDEVGDQSYMNWAIVAAARGDGLAHNKIVEELNGLTKGEFSRQFPGNEPLFLHDNNRIITGYYLDNDNEKKDIRCIDGLALLNLTAKKAGDCQIVNEWMDTYNHTNIDIAIRMERRIRILESVLPNRVSVKGYAQRVTCNPKLIPALAMSARISGLNFLPKNISTNLMNNQQHGIINANNLYGVAAHNSGLFNLNQGGGTGFSSNWNGPAMTGWSRPR